jgi:hypothetical protein
MATDLIRYDLLVQDALRSVVRKVLADTARNGLMGEHHFNIAFKTHAPGVVGFKLEPRVSEPVSRSPAAVEQKEPAPAQGRPPAKPAPVKPTARPAAAAKASHGAEKSAEPEGEAKVVSIDAFRNK